MGMTLGQASSLATGKVLLVTLRELELCRLDLEQIWLVGIGLIPMTRPLRRKRTMRILVMKLSPEIAEKECRQDTDVREICNGCFTASSR